MPLTRRSTLKLICGAVTYFGPPLLSAAGRNVPRTWESTWWTGLREMQDYRKYHGALLGKRNDGQLFRVELFCDPRHYHGVNAAEVDTVLQLEDPFGEMRNAVDSLNTFLSPNCWCSAYPRRVCEEHQELYCQDVDGNYLY